MSNSIRIRTTPNGTDKYLSLKLEQDFDFIEILSLKISQEKAYERFCSDYGVIAGRVIINSGFGIPNAKVSVFIPISEEDKKRPEIKSIYPYENVSDVDSNGVRYNLLPKENDTNNDCYTIIGTFPSKREQLDNDEMLEVYCKYYKFTTTTNFAGDFMIFGVPLGQHTVHVDVDMSDIGIASQKPYNLIDQGTPLKFFNSPTKFKKNKNLNSLAQVKSANIGVNVQPFWGDLETCVVGINRLDIDLNYNINPTAIFMGSIFGDSQKNSINKRCRPRSKMGSLCEQVPRAGTIEMLRKNINGDIERFDVDGGRVIDDNGAWAYQIPMNLDYITTDEEGNLIPSDDQNIGIPTRARVRFRISMDEGGGLGRLRTRGKYIIPHNPKNNSDINFSFDKKTPDNENTFRDFYWNKIYTVKNFIPRAEKGGISLIKPYKRRSHTGIKNVDGCVGDKSPMPYNRAYVKGNILFIYICFLFSLIGLIVNIFNGFLCALAKICIPLGFTKICPFKFLRNFLIKLKCPNEDESKYTIGCPDSLDAYLDCVSAVLAEELNLFEFDFYNDWVNGTLYYYLLKYKRKNNGREKFCETYCNDYNGGTGNNTCKTSILLDTTYNKRNSTRATIFTNGLLVKYENNLYYPPILINGSGFKLFSTDIVNLGSILDCDWQGLPKIIPYLTNSSYKLPPLLAETYADDGTDVPLSDQSVVVGMFDFAPPSGINYNGLFFNVNCIDGVDFDSIKARNIRRQCELNVDLLEYTGSSQINLIGISEIYDTTDPVDVATSINRYVRDSFYLLNVSGTSISALPQVSFDLLDKYKGTSFNVVDTSFTNGDAYDKFRGWIPPASDKDMSFQTQNSFYMYFGLIPGKTGLDKLKSNFLTECVREKADDFIIDTTPKNISVAGANDGSISFTFIGGSYPFTYTWDGISVSYSYGPFTTDTQPPSGIITGLEEGTYQITAIDAIGTIVTKEVTVGEPLGFICSYVVSQTPSTLTSTDGIIEIIQISNGILPYKLTILDSNNALYGQILTFTNEPSSEPIQFNFKDDKYTFTVTDNSGQTCIKTIEIRGPQPLSITNLEIYNACNNDCSGLFAFDVAGGTPPYNVTGTFSAKTQSGPYVAVSTSSSGDTIQNDLCAGFYKVDIEDSGEPTPQTISANITINPGMTISTARRAFAASVDIIVVVVTGGVSPYTVIIDDKPIDPSSQWVYQTIVDNNKRDVKVAVYDDSACQIEVIVP